MHLATIDLLCCPGDKGDLGLAPTPVVSEGEVRAGSLLCRECGSVYIVEDFIANLVLPNYGAAIGKEREARARDKDAPEYEATLDQYESRLELNAIARVVTPLDHQFVLDVGAGTGRLTRWVARQASAVIALDISPVSLGINRSQLDPVLRGTVDFVAADSSRLPIRSGVADRVVSAMMLEHIQGRLERELCIAELARVARPDGRLAMTAYNQTFTHRRRGTAKEGFHGEGLYYYRMEAPEFRTLLSEQFLQSRVTGILNLPHGIQLAAADRLLESVQMLASHTGTLLLGSAARPRHP